MIGPLLRVAASAAAARSLRVAANEAMTRAALTLGAALAIPARLRMFNWLRRRHQCGSECQICSERCTVQAIHPTGEINPNECIYCLECQTYYVDDHICPPLVASRKKRERRLALAAGQDISAERPDNG